MVKHCFIKLQHAMGVPAASLKARKQAIAYPSAIVPSKKKAWGSAQNKAKMCLPKSKRHEGERRTTSKSTGRGPCGILLTAGMS